jgi:hypothetical protein
MGLQGSCRPAKLSGVMNLRPVVSSLLLLASRTALAQPAPPPPPPPAAATAPPAGAPNYTAPPIPDSSAHLHDGSYLRMGIGGGWLSLKRSASLSSTLTGEQTFNGDSTIEGGGGALELDIGGTVGSGVVIAGSLVIQSENSKTLKPDNGADVELGGNLGLLLLGPTVDWYPSPTGGFHFGGTLALAVAAAKTPAGSRFENLGGGGVALSLLAGYDFWIADQWSLGGMLRLTGGRVHGEATQGTVTAKEDDTVRAISLQFVALYH